MPRCTAEYDPYGGKQCVLHVGHRGRHRAEWQQAMTFDHDHRDPHAPDWLD